VKRGQRAKGRGQRRGERVEVRGRFKDVKNTQKEFRGMRRLASASSFQTSARCPLPAALPGNK
jgi:hypothetical protein